MRWIKEIVFVLGCLAITFLVWALLAQIPFWKFAGMTDAGGYGDAFGMANSLFAAFGTLGVAIALLLQWREIHQTAIRQDEQAILQAEQTAMQKRQMELAEATARIQKETFDEAKRRAVMDEFLRISRDTVDFKHAFMSWHPDNLQLLHSQVIDAENQRRAKQAFFDAYARMRSHCLAVGLLFDHAGDPLGKAIQDLYSRTSELVGKAELPAAAAEEIIDDQIRRVEQSMKPLWELVKPRETSSR